MAKKTILCLDDERTILTSLKGQLKRNFGSEYGYEFAESPDEALDLIEELVDEDIEILLIVSDWLMPEMKGDEFLIKVHEKFPKIVKVMLTGQADNEAVARAEKEANLYKCLQKPWTEEELITTIRDGISLL
ncbi:response regulator [Paracrocinitomix mangrovi]|uniref:response regulator n=1 Tax=Paracrocinitomix mangrovi TaxID=2862509 RepID=UPI001C8F1451|nr:response regulator [Paracrocinitomix mangrovi]UKN02064.1 response regulator [Paracrocinitomix mangrovi]